MAKKQEELLVEEPVAKVEEKKVEEKKATAKKVVKTYELELLDDATFYSKGEICRWKKGSIQKDVEKEMKDVLVDRNIARVV